MLEAILAQGAPPVKSPEQSTTHLFPIITMEELGRGEHGHAGPLAMNQQIIIVGYQDDSGGLGQGEEFSIIGVDHKGIVLGMGLPFKAVLGTKKVNHTAPRERGDLLQGRPYLIARHLIPDQTHSTVSHLLEYACRVTLRIKAGGYRYWCPGPGICQT